MSWSWIFRILWARRVIILIATCASLLGGVVVWLTSPPRYLASARVTLDYVKPDLLTGQYMPTKMVNAYVSSQVQMIRDYQVTIPAVEALGWLDNPDLQEAYAARPPTDKRDFRQWVAARLVSGVSARMVEDSNILEVQFRTASPQLALTVVEALRQAYVDANVFQRRAAAGAKADALSARGEELQAKLTALQKLKSDYEKANNVYLGRGPRDPDSARLRELATGKDQVLLPPEQRVSTAQTALMDIDARIASLGPRLGPNNPTLKDLEARRAVLKAQVDSEQDRVRAVAATVAQMGGMRGRLLEEQKAKVLSQRDKILQLRLYEDEIQRYQEQLNDTLTTAANSRSLTSANESGLTPIGAPEVRPKPVYPIPALILGGSGGLGLVLGVLLALLTEFMTRRVRGVVDMELAGLSPVLGVVPNSRLRRRVRLPGVPVLGGRARRLRPRKTAAA